MKNSAQRTATRLQATWIPYCAKCGFEGTPPSEDAQGKAFVCPNELPGEFPPPRHVKVVKGGLREILAAGRVMVISICSNVEPHENHARKRDYEK